MPDPALRFAGVRKDFVPPLTLRQVATFHWQRKTIHAVARADLDLAAGEVHALVGPNGAGKTTLLKLAAALLEPTEGTVSVLGHDSVRDPLAVRRVVGYCMTDHRSFFLRLTGRENLRFFASLHGLDGQARDDRVREVLEELELETVADRTVLSYSEGMKQRLALARSLVPRPRVLLLDEIGRGLDPRLREKIYRHVRDGLVGTQGVTVLMASHNLDEVEALADTVAVMDAGEVIARGTWSDVRDTVSRVFDLEAARNRAEVRP